MSNSIRMHAFAHEQPTSQHALIPAVNCLMRAQRTTKPYLYRECVCVFNLNDQWIGRSSSGSWILFFVPFLTLKSISTHRNYHIFRCCCNDTQFSIKLIHFSSLTQRNGLRYNQQKKTKKLAYACTLMRWYRKILFKQSQTHRHIRVNSKWSHGVSDRDRQTESGKMRLHFFVFLSDFNNDHDDHKNDDDQHFTVRSKYHEALKRTKRRKMLKFKRLERTGMTAIAVKIKI